MAVLYASSSRKRKGTFRVKACQNLDAVRVTFDDDRAVANAGLVLTATTAQHLGLLDAAQDMIRLDGLGAANAGVKAMTVIEAMVAGADCIDDVDVLRAGSTAKVLGHRVAAPSTIATFLRGFTFGHVRQLDRFAEHALAAAWAAGAGPGDQSLVIDIDSTICEVHGYQKQGAGYGYTKTKGLHPLVAVRADTGEMLHIRFRKGSANTGRGAERFVRETLARARRAVELRLTLGARASHRGDFHLGVQTWARPERDGTVLLGVTDLELQTLDRIERVELPEPGAELRQGGRLLTVLTADGLAHGLWSPLSGRVLSCNDLLRDQPESLRDARNGARWVVRIHPADLDGELPNLIES